MENNKIFPSKFTQPLSAIYNTYGEHQSQDFADKGH